MNWRFRVIYADKIWTDIVLGPGFVLLCEDGKTVHTLGRASVEVNAYTGVTINGIDIYENDHIDLMFDGKKEAIKTGKVLFGHGRFYVQFPGSTVHLTSLVLYGTIIRIVPF